MKQKLTILIIMLIAVLAVAGFARAEEYKIPCAWDGLKKEWGHYEMRYKSSTGTGNILNLSQFNDYEWIPCESIPEFRVADRKATPKPKEIEFCTTDKKICFKANEK